VLFFYAAFYAIKHGKNQMDKTKLTRLVLVLGLIAGCATSSAIAQGKHLQHYYPAYNDLVDVQITFPDDESCADVINNIKTDRSFYRCTNKSASSTLNYHVAFKSTTSETILKIETLSLEECNNHLKVATSGELGKNAPAKAITACAEKVADFSASNDTAPSKFQQPSPPVSWLDLGALQGIQFSLGVPERPNIVGEWRVAELIAKAEGKTTKYGVAVDCTKQMISDDYGSNRPLQFSKPRFAMEAKSIEVLCN
jgi:hypothetical protein